MPRTASPLRVRRVTDPQDPALTAFGRIQEASYYAPETLIPAQYFPQIVRGVGSRKDRILVAESGGEVLGGTIYSLLGGAGFNSFMGVSPAAQGLGVGKALQRSSLAEVRESGGVGMFADSVHGSRQSEAERRAEAETGTDPAQRRLILGALGFRVVDVPYWQPVGGENGGPLQDLDLLFAPAAAMETVPLTLVTGVMRAYWSDWLGPQRADAEAQALAARAGGVSEVALLPASETPRYWATIER